MTIKVFSAGAVKAAVMELASMFEKETGDSVNFTFGAVGSLKARVLAGEAADALILSRPALEQLEGKIQGPIADLGRVGVGIAVRRGAAIPRISTPDALRESLLAAGSIAYGDPAHGDSSGVHFAKVLERLGIAQQVRGKSVLAPSGLVVAELVQQGEVELGATQASVIAACEGIALTGLLPAELQNITTYACGVTVDAAAAQAARRFVAYLGTAAAKTALARAGLEQ